MAREQWSEVVSNMIAKGATGTPEEFATVVDYLARNLPLAPPPASTAAPGRDLTIGSGDKQVVDQAAAMRGKHTSEATAPVATALRTAKVSQA